MTLDSFLSTPVGNSMLDDIVSDRLGPEAIRALSETDLYARVTAAAADVSSAKFRVPPVRMFPWDARISTYEAAALTDAVVTSTAAQWWSSRALDRAQLWIGALDASPASGRPSPQHYGKPPNEIWTSSALDDGTSAWWPLLRRGADSPPPTETQSLWRLTPRADARVYEIQFAHDWARLCTAFPGTDAQPDWDAVAREYDGVHLGVEGLIRAQGVPVETARGTAMLDDWDVESTAWLRWCFDAVARIGELEPDRVHTATPVRHNAIRRGLSALRARLPS